MKKILFLLLVTIASYGQTYQNPTFGTVKTKTAPTVTTTPHLGTVEADGTISKIIPANLPVSTATTNALDLKSNKDSGLLSGGVISVNADPTKWDLAAGEGYITNSLTGLVTPVSWVSQSALTTPYLASSVATYVLINSSGSVVMQNSSPTQQQYRTHIYLGKLAHTTFTTILFSVSEPSRMFDVSGQVSDLNRFLGSGNVDGNIITYNGANLNINASAGMTYRAGANYATDRNSPSITTEPAFTAGTFRNKFRNGSGGWSAVNTTTVDPNYYDNGSGILQLVPNNKWTVKVFWRFGGTGTIHCDYGQVVYDNKVDALAAAGRAAVSEDPETKRDASRRAWLVVKQGVTVLNDISTAEFIPADKLGERSAGSSSIGTLQTAYNNSTIPQVTTTTALGAVTVQEGSGTDSNKVLVGKNNAGTTTFSVNGQGNITGNNITYTTPEEFGAVGDGLTDDTSAIQNAINSGKMVLMNKNYLVSGTVTLSNKTTIYGGGKLITASNLPILDIKSNDIVIDGIRFEGSGRGTATNYTTTRPLQIGINLEGVVDVIVYKNIRISNVSFYNLGGAGIKTANNKDTLYTGGLLVSNCQADLCYIGYYSAERGEYNSFSNAQAINCEYGAYINAGNNAFSNIQFESNRTGMYYGTGVNPGKSTVTGGSINHSLDKGLDLNGLTFGQNFYGVQIQVNDIYVTGSDAVQFINCDIRSNAISVTTSTNTNFKNCKFIITPAFTGLTTCNFSSTEWLLTTPTGFFDINEQPLQVNSKLNVNTGTAVNTSDFANQPNGTIYFSNGATVPIPSMSGKSLSNSALFLGGLASDTNTAGDMRFNVRENDNTDFATLTRSAFIFSRFGTTLIDVLRNGNTTFTGSITAPSYSGGATLTGTPTAPTATVGTNTTQIATTAFVQNATVGSYVDLTTSQTITGSKSFTNGNNYFGNALTHYYQNNPANAISWTLQEGGAAQGHFRFGTNTVKLEMREGGPRYISVTDPIESPAPTDASHLVNKTYSDKNRLIPYTFATLPASPSQGDSYSITDALAPAYLAPAAGGGSVFCPVVWNGTTWVCH